MAVINWSRSCNKLKFKYFLIFFLSLFLVVISNQAFSETLLPSGYKATLQEVYQKYLNDNEGKNASYIPELAKADPRTFAITIVTVDGQIISIGSSDFPFSLQSISKVFSYALAIKDNDQDTIFENIGLDATGDKFNSIAAIENRPKHALNPFVNAGAIQTTSFIKGANSQDKWNRLLHFVQSLSDGKPYFSTRTYKSEMSTNVRNQAIAQLLKSNGLLKGDPEEALDRYTKACSIMVTTRQLAIIGATLANNGVNPITKVVILSPSITRDILSQMLVNGLYEKSGTWLVKIGIPAKSGVSGGLLAIIPNKMAIAVYSSPLDATGTSIRAQKVLRDLSKRWHLHILDKPLKGA